MMRESELRKQNQSKTVKASDSESNPRYWRANILMAASLMLITDDRQLSVIILVTWPSRLSTCCGNFSHKECSAAGLVVRRYDCTKCDIISRYSSHSCEVCLGTAWSQSSLARNDESAVLLSMVWRNSFIFLFFATSSGFSSRAFLAWSKGKP